MSTLTRSARDLALQLAQAGSQHSRALAKVVEAHEISLTDALDLAMAHIQPQKLEELLNKKLRVEQILIIYDVIEAYSEYSEKGSLQRMSIRQLADFADWFLAGDFNEEELVDAIETAIRIFPQYWTRSKSYSSELSYALGYGRAIRDHSIASLEEKESLRIEHMNTPDEELATDADEGQGDHP